MNCDFCRQTSDVAGKLIEGPGANDRGPAYICLSCLKVASDIGEKHILPDSLMDQLQNEAATIVANAFSAGYKKGVRESRREQP